jgi:hypothetical protein
MYLKPCTQSLPMNPQIKLLSHMGHDVVVSAKKNDWLEIAEHSCLQLPSSFLFYFPFLLKY